MGTGINGKHLGVRPNRAGNYLRARARLYIVSFVIGERFPMPLHATTRRSFLKASTLAASAVALRGSNLLAQSTQADARIDILPAQPIATISPEIYTHLILQL